MKNIDILGALIWLLFTSVIAIGAILSIRAYMKKRKNTWVQQHKIKYWLSFLCLLTFWAYFISGDIFGMGDLGLPHFNLPQYPSNINVDILVLIHYFIIPGIVFILGVISFTTYESIEKAETAEENEENKKDQTSIAISTD